MVEKIERFWLSVFGSLAGDGKPEPKGALEKRENTAAQKQNATMTRGEKVGSEPRLCDVIKLESIFILRDLVRK